MIEESLEQLDGWIDVGLSFELVEDGGCIYLATSEGKLEICGDDVLTLIAHLIGNDTEILKK